MKRNTLWTLAAIVIALSASSLLWNFSMQAAPRPGRGTKGRNAANNPEKENFDIREKKSKDAVLKFERRMEKLSSRQKERNDGYKLMMNGAKERRARGVEGLEATFCDLTNSPEIVEVRGQGRKFLTPSSGQPRESIVRGFINDNADLFGMNARQVARLRKSAEYTNPNGRLSWLRMEQRWNGMKVFRGEMVAAFTSDGELVRMVGELTGGPEEQDLATIPKVSAAAAVVAAAASVDVTLTESELIVSESSPDGRTIVFHPTGPFTDYIKVELQYFPLDAGLATLAWSMVLWQDAPAYYTLVDAEEGVVGVLWRKHIVNEQTQPATYVVYDGDSPAPLSPTTALPGSGIQGVAIPRTSFTLVSEGGFNNLGWLTDGVTTTTGNNVDAGLDLIAPDGIDVDGRPISPTRVFDFPYNPAPGIPPPGEAPTLADYRFGEVVNMFFWSNRYHDRLYELGFTEEHRNFQTNNFGRGGLGNDPVLAHAQDFSGTNNANFATPPDGFSGRMQMFIFTGPDPDRSSGLDQEIIIHELTHGTSNRLHNNAAGLNAVMSGGMGEGWSDFYALALLAQPGDDHHGIYAVGGYSTLNIVPGFTDNYYYGIRRFPHATISTIGPNGKPHNPLTFADIDPAQINLTDGAFPRGPIGSSFAFQVHNIGEVWCAALWEVRARIIDRMGFAAGSQRTLQLVTDGMKLDPVTPTLLDGRDSILRASCSAFEGQDEQDIWAGFAARGMGASARAISSSSSSVVEAFDMPNLNLGAVTITDDSCAPPDGFADPGETLTLNIPLNNPFCATGANGVTVSVQGGSSVSYGDIPAGGTVSRGIPFTVPSDTPCGSQLPLEIAITSSLGTVTRTFNLQIGRPVRTITANYSSGNIAVPIPDLTTVDIPINVTDVGVVSDVNVKVRLNHTFDGDLVLTLIGPDGTSVALANNRGGSGQNFGAGANDCSGVPTAFDDSASIPIGAGTAPFAGAFRPESPLSAFNGKPVTGVWVLRIADVFGLDFGTVGCVQLEISRQRFGCCGVPGTPEIAAAPPVTVTSESCAPNNGAPDPDETVTVNFPLLNIGLADTTNLVATLLPGGGVISPSGPQTYGVLVSDGPAVARPFTFTAAGVCGGNLTATLALQDGATDLGTVTFTIRIGATISATSSFSNPASIIIPAVGTGDPTGAPSNPYPSTINVSGITGTVSKVTVQLFNFTHSFPNDVDVLLVGPGGQKLLLMSDIGGVLIAANVNLTFDDAAPPIPIGATVVSGTFRPTNSGTGDLFPAPAPPGPYPDPQQLSIFNGVNPNGTWSLFVVDDITGFFGNINGGWRLNITTSDTSCPIPAVAAITGQYSDEVTLKANVPNVTCPGGVVEFRVNGSVVGSAPVTSGAAAVPFTILLAQGSYPITATLITPISGAVSSGSGTLTVTREDAIVTLVASNPAAVKVNAPRGTAGPINLCATINEAPDESPGDITLAMPVTFTLTPVAQGTPPITQTAIVGVGGPAGTITACVALNNVPVNVYDVGISVGGNFYTGSGGSQLSVFDPALGAFKGLGTIIRNGRPALFFFNIKYNRNGSPQGSLIYAERRPSGLAQLRSASIQSLSIVGNTGVIVGTATFNGAGNHRFRATVADNGKPTRVDRFGLQVIAPSGAIIPELTFDPVALGGGSIKK